MKIAMTCVAYLLAGLVGRLQAQNIESVELNDGSVLEGYISEQYPGKSIVFSACRATIAVPGKAIASFREHRMNYASLPTEWKQWMDAHAKGEKDMLLSDILLVAEPEGLKAEPDSGSATLDRQKVVPDYLRLSPRKVKVLEKGAMVKYLDLTPQTYPLKWSDVKFVRRSRRSSLALSGLNEVIRLKEDGNEYTGEIVEQVLGKQIRLLKKDGVIEVINSNQMASTRKEKLNPDQEIFEQVPLLDHVYTRSGNTITGIIMEQNFINQKDKAGYLTVLSKSGESRIISYPEVEKYGRSLNPDYQLLTDVLLDDTTVMVNRQKVKFTSFEQDPMGFLYVTDSTHVMVLRRDSLEDRRFIVLEVKDQPEANEYTLIRAVEKTEVEKKREQKKLGFTYENFVIYSTRAVEQTVSVNGTRKMNFAINNPGWYVLYLPKMKKGILCLVE